MRSWGIYILAALGFVVYGAMTDADRDGTGAIVGEGNVDAFQVRVGDCFNDADSFADEISSVAGIPCSDPHDNEAYAVLNLTIGDYPEGDAMGDLANESCLEHFASFAGTDFASSSLDVFAIYPSTESWKQNDREVICSVFDMNSSKLVGSMQGLAR